MAAQAKPQTEILHASEHIPLRFITAASLFDGHDASINIIRRLIQDQGAEVVHLGHNRSVDEIISAAVQEDVNGIAVSSYQGGHMEFFRYLIDRLRSCDASHIGVFGGGGGTITPDEASQLEAAGVEKIYSPEDGRHMGIEGMVRDLIERAKRYAKIKRKLPSVNSNDERDIARMLSLIEQQSPDAQNLLSQLSSIKRSVACPVIGFSGTGGSGKSTVIDELLARILFEYPDLRIAMLAVDPTRHKTGGALLGDRIRMNSIVNEQVFMRSMATRRRHLATNIMLADCISYLRSRNFNLIVVETAGTGQADSEVVDLADVSIYVMTSDYGSSGQLEKIEMLDCADLVALNKYDKRGAVDALADIRKQWRRNHKQFEIGDDGIPVFPTVASQLHDAGVGQLYTALCKLLDEMDGGAHKWSVKQRQQLEVEPHGAEIIPQNRVNYLGEISDHARSEKASHQQQVDAASRAYSYYQSLKALDDTRLPEPFSTYDVKCYESEQDSTLVDLRRCYDATLNELSPESINLLRNWQTIKHSYESDHYTYKVRDQEHSGENYTQSLSHLRIPKVALPRYTDWGELLQFLLNENLPGAYPYTAGVYPYRRSYEEPARMFAGEGVPESTNRRFHYLIQGQPTIRLSTAFDPIALYGQDPDTRPDVYGRIGMSGVSVATVDDIKKLYSGIDLCDSNTSVSMTINGPAPAVLAMFFNAAIDQQVEKYLHNMGLWRQTQQKIAEDFKGRTHPRYYGDLPKHHHELGLGLLGISGKDLVAKQVYDRICKEVFKSIRGTVQADILKEDQAQNECIFSVECALRMMGDIQQFFVTNDVRNFYSVSVSGYHIAEAGANPITQLAFTLANGFTLVEYYLSRGMNIDDFAPNLSFFFSNGMDPGYAVIGRVARRIWSRAMRKIYHANSRSQMLKYHIQTSGRSLHAQEIGFNDIRTTLQALYAVNDNCNSLHTNAFDEAVTTPTEDSVRRALAIQMIINRELGLNTIQNTLQGSFAIEMLTDLVEEAVFEDFDRISERGGVLSAMETQYQRNKIQEQSLYYERCKHDGSMPIVGVNTFTSEISSEKSESFPLLIRSTDEEKTQQITEAELFRQNHADQAPAVLQRLQTALRSGSNTFAELMDTVRHCSLGYITRAINEVGGQYRRRI